MTIDRHVSWARGGGGSSRVRKALAVLALAFAFAVTCQVSVAGAFRSRQPLIALAWLPADALAREKLASNLAAASTNEKARRAAAALATDAIRRDPLVPAALWALAVARNGQGQDESAAASLNTVKQAERLSRRHVQTQLWLAQNELRRGDVSAVIEHFDIALRTSTSSRDTIFPLLAAAADDPEIAATLAEHLRARPVWAVPFAGYVVSDGANLARRIALLHNQFDPAVPEELGLIQGAVEQLAVHQQYAAAWQIYTEYGLDRRAGSVNELLRDGSFESTRESIPFAWSLSQEPDLWAERESLRRGSGHALRLMAQSGAGGVVAQQLVRLPPNDYELRAIMGDVPRDPFQRPELQIRCAAGEGKVLLMLKPQRAGAAAQQLASRFAVPPGCSFQWVTVSLASEGRRTDFGSWIDDIRLTAARS